MIYCDLYMIKGLITNVAERCNWLKFRAKWLL